MSNRREFILAGLAVALTPQWALAASPVITVAKAEGCPCCEEWVKHLQDNGFQVEAGNVSVKDLQKLKDELGITSDTASCHTAQVEGYVIEGHVPARDIKTLLAKKPKARGLSVPGMPLGSPGMGAPQDGEGFDVILILDDGKTQLWSTHQPSISA